MTLERQARLLCRINAVINWTLSPRGVVDPVGMATAFGGVPPNYPFVIRLWSAFVFMFGCMFWEISRDMQRKRALIKYSWIEKSVTAISVTLGFFGGSAPAAVFVLVIFTDWLWIPIFAYYDVQVRRRTASAARA